MNLLIADNFPQKHLDAFRALGLRTRYEPSLTAEQLVEAASEEQVLVVRSTKVVRAVIENAKKLALIIRAGAGYDTIDVAAASERGIFVTNCPGKNSVAVAELAMGLIVSLDRRIAQSTADLRRGRWNKKEYSKAEGLKGKVIGVAGLGPIARAVIDRAHAFEMDVVAWSRSLTESRAEELGIRKAHGLLDLAEQSDIVSVHLPQTAETKKAFNAAFFAKMKRGAIFINTSRGGLHDQDALYQAMQNNDLRVGLDVYEGEPPEGTASFQHPMFDSPNFVGTHHIGASTEQAQDAIAEESVRICREFIATGRAPNVVNIETRAPATCELIVRHYDKVGVLASVLGLIRNYGLNVEDMTNTIFQGARAAIAGIRISSEPPAELIEELKKLSDLVIHVEVKVL